MDGNGTVKGLTLALVCIAAIAYTLILQTGPGKRLAHEKTHYSVIIGIVMVLLAQAIVLDFSDWVFVVATFVVAGIPIVLRSEYNDLQDHDKAKRRLDDDEAKD